ncbi:MAG: lytic transglycosylase domain-containing protein [Actinomycetota bacterium]|nr:lytic transglycosylase domain-containing protein [Actinomycetota bacterium]
MILPARQPDGGAGAAPGPASAPFRPPAAKAVPLTAPDAGRLALLLEDAQARRARLSLDIATAEKALAGLEADRQGAQSLFEKAAAEEGDLGAARAQLLGSLSTAQGDARAAEVRMASVAVTGSVTPVAHPPARGDTPADQGARAQRALADARQHLGELNGALDRQLVQLQQAGEQTMAASGRVQALDGQLRSAQDALGALHQQMAAVADDLTASTGLLDALGAAEPSALALADIPAPMLALYRRAASTCPGLAWSVLAAVGSVETSHGRAQLPGVRTGANSAGAMGPMQFLAATWTTYGADGDGDGVIDVYNPADAILGAARYLCASGAGQPAGLVAAIWAYNHADWYVEAVLEVAAGYGAPSLAAAPVVAAVLVDSPHLILSPEARADLLDGTVDTRLVALLAAASVDHALTVSVIRTGHAMNVAGTDRVSNHFYGRAVDISAVDGAAVSASNQAAFGLALSILASGPTIRPDELGSPWTSLGAFPGAFSDEGHADHLHLGWR